MDYREYLQRFKLISELSQATPLKTSEDLFILQLILSNISRQAKAELCVIPDSMNKKGEYYSIVNLVR